MVENDESSFFEISSLIDIGELSMLKIVFIICSDLLFKIVESQLRATELQTNGCFGPDIRAWLLDNLNIIWIKMENV